MTAAELRARRKQLGLSQAEIAERIGSHRVTVTRWETEAEPIPRWLDLAMTALEQGQ